MPESRNERVFSKNVAKRILKEQNERIFNKNVPAFSGRHWNMKKLCPGKAKFFR